MKQRKRVLACSWPFVPCQLAQTRCRASGESCARWGACFRLQQRPHKNWRSTLVERSLSRRRGGRCSGCSALFAGREQRLRDPACFSTKNRPVAVPIQVWFFLRHEAPMAWSLDDKRNPLLPAFREVGGPAPKRAFTRRRSQPQEQPAEWPGPAGKEPSQASEARTGRARSRASACPRRKIVAQRL